MSDTLVHTLQESFHCSDTLMQCHTREGGIQTEFQNAINLLDSRHGNERVFLTTQYVLNKKNKHLPQHAEAPQWSQRPEARQELYLNACGQSFLQKLDKHRRIISFAIVWVC